MSEMGKLINPTTNAVILIALSLFMKRRRSAPARGINMTVERIGKLSVFIMRYFSIFVNPLHSFHTKPQDKEKYEQRQADICLNTARLKFFYDIAETADRHG